MAEARAVVVAVDGDVATVQMDEQGCGRCHEPGGCGGTNIGTMLCATPRMYQVENPLGAVVGEQVTLEIDQGVVNRGAMLAYGVPLVMVLGGAAVGGFFSGNSGAMLGAFAGLVVAWTALRFVTRSSVSTSFHPRIRK